MPPPSLTMHAGGEELQRASWMPLRSSGSGTSSAPHCRSSFSATSSKPRQAKDPLPSFVLCSLLPAPRRPSLASAVALTTAIRSYTSLLPLHLLVVSAACFLLLQSNRGKGRGKERLGLEMSGGEEDDVRKVSRQDIQLVQNLIERCLQLYMNQKEVVETLSFQAKIEPSFTELVWQKLEEENHEFFKAYYVRLMLKNQIMVFNKLLEDQYRLMSKEQSSGVPSMTPTAPNGSDSSTMNQNTCFLADSTSTAMSDSFLLNGNSGGMINDAPATDQFIYAGKVVHGLPSGMDASASLLSAHSSTVGQFNGGNGTTIKAESSFSSNPEFAFCNDSAFLEPCQSMGDASGGSFSSSELNGHPISEPIPDMDTSSYGFLGQIPRNFNFSDLTEDFIHSTEILENYGRSPFIPSESNFSESTAGEHTEIGNRRLNSISEGVSYEDFGSD
ncbi:hypothetical protein ACQ4PT_000879 [Festuca glaucescens]